MSEATLLADFGKLPVEFDLTLPAAQIGQHTHLPRSFLGGLGGRLRGRPRPGRLLSVRRGRQVFGVLQSGLSIGVGENQAVFADDNGVAVSQPMGSNPLPVDKGPVLAFQVRQQISIVLRVDPGVMPGNREVFNGDVVAVLSPDGQRPTHSDGKIAQYVFLEFQRERRHANPHPLRITIWKASEGSRWIARSLAVHRRRT